MQWRTTSLALRGQDPTVMLSSILSQLSVHRLDSQTRNAVALRTGIQRPAKTQQRVIGRVIMAFDQHPSLSEARLPTTHRSCQRRRLLRAAFHLPPPPPLWPPTRLHRDAKRLGLKQQRASSVKCFCSRSSSCSQLRPLVFSSGMEPRHSTDMTSRTVHRHTRCRGIVRQLPGCKLSRVLLPEWSQSVHRPLARRSDANPRLLRLRS